MFNQSTVCSDVVVHVSSSQTYTDDDVPSDAHISAIAVQLESQLDESTLSFFSEAAEFIASQVDLLPEDPFADDQQVKECKKQTDFIS